MENKAHFIALLTYFEESISGKSTPFPNGSRAGFLFDFKNKIIFGNYNFLNQEIAYPNDIVNTQITLLTDLKTLGMIYVGLDFDFFEGELQIGKGIITKLIE